jgi:hypothetical protein
MTASFQRICNEKTQKRIENEFAEKGFNDVSVSVSTTNGESIYVNIILKVVNEQKLFKGMKPCEWGYVKVQIRMSDHFSGLEKNRGGYHVDQFSAKMTLPIFESLIQSGAVQASN